MSSQKRCVQPCKSLGDELTTAAPVQNIPLDIVFEDDHLLVINNVRV